MKLTEAQIARLHGLASERGELLPSRVVEDAKRKTSPLHTLFEWDVKAAAAIQWIDRAREIIGSVVIVVQRSEYVVKTPAYTRDPDAKGEGYRSVTALRDDPVAARASLRYTLEVASGHLRRAYDLAEPLGLAGEIDKIVEDIMGVQRKISTAA